MISGMSSEKPAELLLRWILRIWSVYDVNGDVIRLYSIRSAFSSLAGYSTPPVDIQQRRAIFKSEGHEIHRMHD